MTAEQFRSALAIAKADVDIDSEVYTIDNFLGCGLKDFAPINVTLEALARFIRYQCAYMYGGMDENELENIKWIARRKFTLISPKD